MEYRRTQKGRLYNDTHAQCLYGGPATHAFGVLLPKSKFYSLEHSSIVSAVGVSPRCRDCNKIEARKKTLKREGKSTKTVNNAPLSINVCRNCREPLPSNRHKYCSRCLPYIQIQHSRKHDRKRGSRGGFVRLPLSWKVCPRCGWLQKRHAFVRGKRNKVGTVCRSCRNEKRRQERAARVPVIRSLVCSQCGISFDTTKAQKIYCSIRCCNEASRKRTGYRWIDPKRLVSKIFPKECVVCGKLFFARSPNTMNCSVECSEEYGRVQGREYMRKKRIGRKEKYPLFHWAEFQKLKAWKKANPEKVRIRNRLNDKKRLAAMIANGECTFTEGDWAKLLEEHNYRCFYCFGRGGSKTRDHIVPLAKGGTHTWDNIVPSCPTCNSYKSTRPIEEFLEWIHSAPEWPPKKKKKQPQQHLLSPFVHDIRHLLALGDMTQKEIAKRFSVGHGSIGGISRGKTYFDKSIYYKPYAVQKEERGTSGRLTQLQIRDIRHLLALGDMTQREITEHFPVSRWSINAINTGRTHAD